MARGKREGVLIAGGGVAGCLAALAMARLRPDVPLTIVEERTQFGGEGDQYLLDAELEEAERDLAAPLIERSWPGFYLAFPDLSRKLKAEVATIGPTALHHAMIETLREDQYRLGARIVAVREDALELDGGETLRAEGTIDARGAANLSMLQLIFESRVERVVVLEAPHRLDRPLLVDAHVDQKAGFEFVEAWPLDAHRLRLALLLVSGRAQPDEGAAGRLDEYLALRGWSVAKTETEAARARPLPVSGDFDAFWRIGGARVAKLGLRGGFVEPMSGRTLPDALRCALLLARQRDFGGAALHDAFEAEARQTWKKRELGRQINAALAGGAPETGRAVAARLWAMEAGTLIRLRSERLGLLDRRRVQQALRAG